MRISGLLLCVAWLVSLGCGDEDDSPSGTISVGMEDAGAPQPCIDEDGDGYGAHCTRGDDCDDSDTSITDECVRCTKVVATGCPCEPGTKPMECDPKDVKTTNAEGVRGTLVCSEGTRYCRDGFYSDCEALAQYTFFVAD
jgi:hypothetical protein